MKTVWLIGISFWSFSVLLNLSPFHDYYHAVNFLLIAFVYLNNLFIWSPIKQDVRGVQHYLTKSVTRLRFYQITTLIMTIASFVMLVIIVVRYRFNLSEARKMITEDVGLYNYIFIIFACNPLVLILAVNVGRLWKRIAILGFLGTAGTMLLCGNRQFVFYSIMYILVYKLAQTRNKRKSLRLIFFSAVFASIIFLIVGINRLDYIGDDSISSKAGYLSSLSGLKAKYDFVDSTSLGTICQILYMYFGVNWSGLNYAVHAYYDGFGFPLFSTTLPLFARRLTGFDTYSEGNSAWLNNSFDDYAFRFSGVDFNHIFLTMFGSVAIESGLTGIMIFSILLGSLVRWLINEYNVSLHEVDFVNLSGVITCLFFGLMQFPLTENFVTSFLLTGFCSKYLFRDLEK